jgi:hypothetical protein
VIVATTRVIPVKRLVMALVAFLTLCSVQSVKADWTLEVGIDGWIYWRWDPGLDTGFPTLPPSQPPLMLPPDLFWVDGVLYMYQNGQLFYWNGSQWVPY